MLTPPIRAMLYPRKEKPVIVARKLLILKPKWSRAPLRSALALLVPQILADDPHDALAADDLAVAADSFDRCQYFHFQLLAVSYQRSANQKRSNMPVSS